MKLRLLIIIHILFFLNLSFSQSEKPIHTIDKKEWKGFAQEHFVFNGKKAFVTKP